jgi:CRISPR-associated protein Csb2
MRLYQALVAGVGSRYRAEGGIPNALAEAFRWLEQLPAPFIEAPISAKGSPYSLAVPDNHDDQTYRDLSRGVPFDQVARDRKSRYSLKTVQRQRFDGDLHYWWPVSDQDAPIASRIIEATGFLFRLGLGVDLAFARGQLVDREPMGDNLFRPSGPGEGIRVPVKGSFESLEVRFHARSSRMKTGQYLDLPYLFDEVRYTSDQETPDRPRKIYRLLDVEKNVLLSWPQRKTVTMAAMIRHAVTTANQEDPYLHDYSAGHPKGTPADRLSWIPLPSLGHDYVDGRIRRAMVLGPVDGDPAPFERATFGISYALLHQHDVPVARLVETAEMDGAIRPYFGISDTWSTITPLVLPGHDDGGKKAGRLAYKALANEGIPVGTIRELEVQKAPFHRGSLRAGDYMGAAHMNKYPQYHVRIILDRPIAGPVLAGVGRHYGLGLFFAEG